MKAISLLDRKILYELDKNARQPLNKLARSLRISRTALEYRIKKLEKSGVLSGFVTMVHPRSLGLQAYKLYLQLSNIPSKEESRLITFFRKFPLYWLAKCNGRWDYIVGILAASPQEFNAMKLEILNFLKGHVIDKDVTLMVDAPHFRRDYLIGKKSHDELMRLMAPIKPISLDKEDYFLLRLMGKNARISTLHLAQKLKLSAKTAARRIARLEKSGVIYAYRIAVDHEKLGVIYMKVFISLKTITSSDKSRFLEYCKGLPNLISLVECLGRFDFEANLEVESSEQCYSIIKGIRDEFSEIILGVDVLHVVKEYEYTTVGE